MPHLLHSIHKAAGLLRALSRACTGPAAEHPYGYTPGNLESRRGEQPVNAREPVITRKDDDG